MTTGHERTEFDQTLWISTKLACPFMPGEDNSGSFPFFCSTDQPSSPGPSSPSPAGLLPYPPGSPLVKLVSLLVHPTLGLKRENYSKAAQYEPDKQVITPNSWKTTLIFKQAIGSLSAQSSPHLNQAADSFAFRLSCVFFFPTPQGKLCWYLPAGMGEVEGD